VGQVAVLWACAGAARRGHWLGGEMYGVWGGGSGPREVDQGAWREVVRRDWRAHSLGEGYAVDCGGWGAGRDWMMIRMVGG